MAKTKKSPKTRFETLLAEAMSTLRLALAEKEADNIYLSVWRGRADAKFELLYEPSARREVEGSITSDGEVITLGWKR